MAKAKASGLGRGLGDLFEDNAPEIIRPSGKVVVRSPEGDKVMTRTKNPRTEVFFRITNN